MLRFGAVCTKHPAFREEREWRIVASPSIQSSPLLPQSVEVIGGVPQTVLKIPLVDCPDQGLVGISPPQLIDRVLIGPCEHSAVIRRALHQVLEEAGVQGVEGKIVDTGIPLRANQR